MSEDWIVTTESILLATYIRRRALLLEGLLPFGSPIPDEVMHDVTTVQRLIRGFLARRHVGTVVNQQHIVRKTMVAWKIGAQEVRAREMACLEVYRTVSAMRIQNAFRAFLSHWTRPRVSELLARIRSLEGEDRTGMSKKKIRQAKRGKRFTNTVACQTNDFLAY